ncbi:MAG: YdbL family protein [Nitrosomonadales bacterium]|nr:YdbL family protein [Nitrosomonadales bacterium]
MKTCEATYAKALLKFAALLVSSIAAMNAFAAADFEIDTPGVAALKQLMRARHAQLAGYYTSGAVGLTADGMIGLRDVSAVPQAERYTIFALVAAENQNRNALYAEIARANSHPEWEGEIRNTFARRWVQNARTGWWIQDDDGWERR